MYRDSYSQVYKAFLEFHRVSMTYFRYLVASSKGAWGFGLSVTGGRLGLKDLGSRVFGFRDLGLM